MNKEWVIYKAKIYFNEEVKQIIEDWEVYLQNQQWQMFQMGTLCSWIVEWNVGWLWLQKNFRKQIINQIKMIKFPDLRQIFLKQNLIESIEGINRMQFPQLQIILFDFNFITSIRDFRKLTLHKLNGIGLTNNKIIDPEKLTELSIATQNQFLQIEVFRNVDMCGSLGWILKTKTNLHRLYIRGLNRIEERQVKEVLARKTYYIQILEENY